MKFYVRTTGERSLSNYNFDYEIMVDKDHNPIKSFINQMRLISNNDAIMLEDDLEFSKDFLTEIEEVISRYSDKVINFFYLYLQFMPTQMIKGRAFLNNQCVYYPKGVSEKIADEMQRLIDNGFQSNQYDQIQAKAMDNLDIDFISYRPMLVQHIGGTQSMMGNTWINQGKTIFFKDDLPCNYDNFKEILEYAYKKYNELGIKYPKIIIK